VCLELALTAEEHDLALCGPALEWFDHEKIAVLDGWCHASTSRAEAERISAGDQITRK
jgi:hypothetical protein